MNRFHYHVSVCGRSVSMVFCTIAVSDRRTGVRDTQINMTHDTRAATGPYVTRQHVLLAFVLSAPAGNYN